MAVRAPGPASSQVKELFGETYYNAAKRSIDYILGGSQSESVGYVVPVLSCNESINKNTHE